MIWWPSLRAVVDYLQTDGDLTEPVEIEPLTRAAAQLDAPVPWYLKGALFIGGLFAGSVLACTCAPLGALSSGVAFLAPGVIVMLLAVVVRHARPSRLGEWLDPLLFAGMIAGTLLMLLGLVMTLDTVGLPILNDRVLSITAGLLGGTELLLLLAFPDRWHRTLGTIVLCGCLSVISWDLSLWPVRDVVTGLAVALGAASLAARPIFAGTPLRELLGPVGLGFVLYALGGMARFWSGWAEEGWIVVVGLASGTLALGVVSWTLYRVQAPAIGWVVGLLGTVILVLLGLSMPGLAVALSFMLLALLCRHPAVLVASILALVSYGAWAYTDFEWPVVLKALALVGSGGVLLGLRAVLRWTASPEPTDGEPTDGEPDAPVPAEPAVVSP